MNTDNFFLDKDVQVLPHLPIYPSTHLRPRPRVTNDEILYGTTDERG